MSTRRNTGLSAGARGTAALLCVLMALTDIGWIIRDLNIAQHPADLWWTWLGEVRRPGEFTAWATSALDPLLVLGALAAAAAACIRDRLWVLGAGWLQGLQSGLTGRARLTAGAQLALAVVLAVVVAAGRRPDDSADEDLRGVTRRAYGVVHRLPDDEPDDAPGRPYKGQAGALAALLGTAGPALAAWEVHWVLRLGWDVYRKGLLGDASAFRALLQPPVHWQMTACALLSLGAAVAALRRASWARPAALAAGALLAVQGAGVLVFAAGTGQLGQFPLLPGQAQLELGTAVVVALAGAAAAVVAARPGVPDSRPEAGGALAYDASPEAERPPHAPPPPSRLPPGW